MQTPLLLTWSAWQWNNFSETSSIVRVYYVYFSVIMLVTFDLIFMTWYQIFPIHQCLILFQRQNFLSAKASFQNYLGYFAFLSESRPTCTTADPENVGFETRRRNSVISKGPARFFSRCKSEPSHPRENLCAKTWLVCCNFDPVAFVLLLGEEEVPQWRLADLNV